MLQASFFLRQRIADLSDITADYRYPDLIEILAITGYKLSLIIKKIAIGKALGPDIAVAEILKKALVKGEVDRDREYTKFYDSLTRLFNASLTVSYYPRAFRTSITIALRKLGKDPLSLKGYRPIALLNTIGKVIESIIVQRIYQAFEIYNVLSKGHFGGRKGYVADKAIYTLIKLIANTQEVRGYISVIVLNILGAFDYTSYLRLLHNLRKRRLGGLLAQQISSFLTRRYTSLRLPNFTLEELEVYVGILQGSPLSPPLYIVFNADLVEGIEKLGITIVGQIDDVSILSLGPILEVVKKKLTQAI